jgi:glycine/D-amino acid oxidase-like deaminating enzyme
VAAGHGAWGISTGPASARRVIEAIVGRPTTIPAGLAGDRFGPVS